MLTQLPPRGGPPEVPEPTDRHPMRSVTAAVAADPGAWTADVAGQVRARFDELAGEWHTRDRPGRLDALVDALDRGRVEDRGGLCLELGSGTGMATPLLAEHFRRIVACDLSERMLALAPAGAAPRLLADGARLPLRDGAVMVLALVNALLFPAEAARVLHPDGALVWVNSLGPATPIYLPAGEVVSALPGDWSGVASRAGEGTWAVARRA